jgi:L-iditol 2-dehydrogenase
MRSVRCFGTGDMRLQTEPDPVPGVGEARVRPIAVGLCGTDLRIVEGAFPATPGVVLGHEICGIVDAVGPEARGVREGDLVTIEPHLFCGRCRYCRLGAEHLCIEKRAFGVHLDGGMAEAVVVPARLAFVLPAATNPEIGSMTEPVACAVHGMDRLQPRSGLPLLVIGAGPAGLILTSLARLAGVGPIVVLEPDEHRRAVALELGASFAIDPTREGARQEALDLTAGDGYDYLIEAAGSASGLETAMSLAARGARILAYGVARPADRASLSPYEIYAKELTILGTAINPSTHLRATGLLEALRLERIDTASFPLDEHAAAFEAQRTRQATKILIAPQAA